MLGTMDKIQCAMYRNYPRGVSSARESAGIALQRSRVRIPYPPPTYRAGVVECAKSVRNIRALDLLTRVVKHAWSEPSTDADSADRRRLRVRAGSAGARTRSPAAAMDWVCHPPTCHPLVIPEKSSGSRKVRTEGGEGMTAAAGLYVLALVTGLIFPAGVPTAQIHAQVTSSDGTCVNHTDFDFVHAWKRSSLEGSRHRGRGVVGSIRVQRRRSLRRFPRRECGEP